MGVLLPARLFVRRMLRVVRLNPLQRSAKSGWGENFYSAGLSSLLVKKTQFFSAFFFSFPFFFFEPSKVPFLFFSRDWVSAAVSSRVKFGFDWRQEAVNCI
jgi:hypothetical protein